MDAFSGDILQPCLGSIVEALRNTDRDTGLDIERIREIGAYWEQVVRNTPPLKADWPHLHPKYTYTKCPAAIHQPKSRRVGVRRALGDV